MAQAIVKAQREANNSPPHSFSLQPLNISPAVRMFSPIYTFNKLTVYIFALQGIEGEKYDVLAK
jgi:hypothetical protein